MNRIKEARLKRGLSQADLADRVGVSRQAVGLYETGERKPGGDVLVRMSYELGVSSAYLLGWSDSPERDDHLPPDWEKVVEEAMQDGWGPDDVRRALQMLRLALGRDGEGH